MKPSRRFKLTPTFPPGQPLETVIAIAEAEIDHGETHQHPPLAAAHIRGERIDTYTMTQHRSDQT